MSQTVQKTKKKTYEEIHQEIERLSQKTVKIFASRFVPRLCDALKDEGYGNDEIREKVTLDCKRRHKWEEITIYNCLPSWVHKFPKKVQAAKDEWQKRFTRKAADSFTKFQEMIESTPLPPETSEPNEKLTRLDEETEQELYGIGLGKFGDTDASTRELLGDITEHAAGLFKALMVRKKEIPHSVDADMIVDYIKPTREEWRSLMEEAEETQRARVHNWLSFLADVIEDRLTILGTVKAGKK